MTIKCPHSQLISIILTIASLLLITPVSAHTTADDALIKQGRNRAQGCTRCHGRYGIQKAAERAGMGSAVGKYARQELNHFKVGYRQHPVMSQIAATLSDRDIQAISAWLDSIRK